MERPVALVSIGPKDPRQLLLDGLVFLVESCRERGGVVVLTVRTLLIKGLEFDHAVGEPTHRLASPRL
jgi:hypothetical protein